MATPATEAALHPGAKFFNLAKKGIDMKPSLRIFVLASALLFWCVEGYAQTYPNRPIRVIIPYAPAGGADIIGRLVLDQVSKDTGYNFIVENRVGAGGNIAFAAIAAGQPDGYTLVIATPGLATNPTLYSKLSFSPADFTAITVIGESPLVFMVNPAMPVASIAEFIAFARKSAQPLRFGSAGNGTSSHLAGEVFKAMAGIELQHIPYRGGVAAITDVVGGRIEMTTQPVAESMPFITDSRVRTLGQTGLTRSKLVANVPTIDEAGVKGYSVSTWYILAGPPGMPREIVDTLYRAFDKSLSSPVFKASLEDRGFVVINSDPGTSRKFLDSEYSRWKKIIEDAGIHLD